MSEQEITRHDLKANALLERIAQLENEKAEIRVDLTIVSMQNEELKKQIKELEARVPQQGEAGEDSTDESN